MLPRILGGIRTLGLQEVMWLNTACTYVLWGQLDRLQAFGKDREGESICQ